MLLPTLQLQTKRLSRFTGDATAFVPGDSEAGAAVQTERDAPTRGREGRPGTLPAAS